MDAVEILKKTRIRFKEARARCAEDWEKYRKEIEKNDGKLSSMNERDFLKHTRETANKMGKFEARFDMYDMIDKWLADRIIEVMTEDKKNDGHTEAS